MKEMKKLIGAYTFKAHARAFLVVQWLRASSAGDADQSVVGELRLYLPALYLTSKASLYLPEAYDIHSTG